MIRTTVIRTRLAGLALCLAATTATAATADQGRLGLDIEIQTTSHSLAPHVGRVTITDVAPDSPAAAAGLRAGDRVLRLDDTRLTGAPVRPLVRKLGTSEPGQHLRMTVRHADGGLADVDVVAQPDFVAGR